MGTSLAALLVLAGVIAAAGVWLGRRVAHQRAELLSVGVRQLTAAMARAAETERAEILRSAEINGREEARAAGGAAETALRTRAAEVEARRRRLEASAAGRAQRQELLAAVSERITAARAQIAAHDAATARARGEAAALDRERRAALERAAAETVAEAVSAMRVSEIEETRMVSARSERAAAEAAAEGAVKGAKRIMGIAVGRFYGHYLTERLHSVLPLPPGEAGAAIVGRDEANLRAIESVAGVTLALSEQHDGARTEQGSALRSPSRGGSGDPVRAPAS